MGNGKTFCNVCNDAESGQRCNTSKLFLRRPTWARRGRYYCSLTTQDGIVWASQGSNHGNAVRYHEEIEWASPEKQPPKPILILPMTGQVIRYAQLLWVEFSATPKVQFHSTDTKQFYPHTEIPGNKFRHYIQKQNNHEKLLNTCSNIYFF